MEINLAKGTIAKLELAPSDIVVVRVAKSLTPEVWRLIQTQMETILERAGHANQVMVVEGDMKIEKITKAQIADTLDKINERLDLLEQMEHMHVPRDSSIETRHENSWKSGVGGVVTEARVLEIIREQKGG
jgi:hypothetical protein